VYSLSSVESYICTPDHIYIYIYIHTYIYMYIGCVNYTSTREHVQTFVGTQLIVSTDDGSIITWNGNQLRSVSEDMYRRTHGEKRYKYIYTCMYVSTHIPIIMRWL
jgi:hypothetical protein